MKHAPHRPTAEPAADTHEARCHDCGHEAIGYSDPFSRLFMRLFARFIRKPQFHCATHDRHGGMNDIRYCSCQNIIHATRIVTNDLDAPEVESID